jgi:release factor glutamine methyltransferase
MARVSDPATRVSLSEWIARAASRLHATRAASPRADAERLAAHALGVSWSELWTRMESEVDAQSLDAVLVRRLSGEPLAYIEGSVVFHGIEIACGPGVLAPRPETETLVDVALELIDGVESPIVCDIGTGSGAVAVAVAAGRPDARVIATDISKRAIVWAERNAHGRGIELRHGDLFAAIPGGLRGRIDLVVSNPPYVPDGADLPDDVMAEPHEALFAGPSGTDVLRRLAAETPAWLAPNGALAAEVGTPEQAKWFCELVGGRIVADQTGRPRVVWMRS